MLLCLPFFKVEAYAKSTFFCGGSFGQSRMNAEKDSKFFDSIIESHSFGIIIDIFAGYGYTFLNNVYFGLNFFVGNFGGDLYFNKEYSSKNKLDAENNLINLNSVKLPKNFSSDKGITLNKYEYDYSTKILNGVHLGVSFQFGYQVFNRSTLYGILGIENKRMYLNGAEKTSLSYSNELNVKNEINRLVILSGDNDYLPILSKIDIVDVVNNVYSGFIGIGFKYSFNFLFCAAEMKCNFMKNNLKTNKIEIDEDKLKNKNIIENVLTIDKDFYESKHGVSILTYDGKFSFGFNF